MITIDFETRSQVDLRRTGAYRYAEDPTTEILCLAYDLGYGGDGVQLWKPGDDRPEKLLAEVASGAEVEAHNVGFERAIWFHICHRRYGWPDVGFRQWRCTMAEASRLALPRSLEGVGKALNLDIQKDVEGRRLMLQMCKPRKGGGYFEDADRLARLYAYCKRDVETEKAVSNALHPLSYSELRIWQLDQRINLRGLAVDLTTVDQLINLVEVVSEAYRDETKKLTGGQVNGPSEVAALMNWIKDTHGEAPPNLRANTVAAWLHRDDLADDVRRVLEIRALASKASTAKLKKIRDQVCSDGRVRGNLVYHGAATGRWAGAGMQIQNFPRGILNAEKGEVDLAYRLFDHGPEAVDLVLGDPLAVISSSLRSIIKAEKGKRLLVCDYAAIEARVLAWLAFQADLLRVFREGGYVYKSMASKIYGVPADDVTKAQRQIGKMAILGLGYGMGWRAFRLACKAQAGVDISGGFARKVVKTYRDANAQIKAFWSSVGTAAVRAIQTQKPHKAGKVDANANRDWLTIRLPSGRELAYRSPRIEEVKAPWTVGYTADLEAPERHAEPLEDLDIKLGPRQNGAWRNCQVPLKAFRKVDKIATHAQVMEPSYIPQVVFDSVNGITRKWEPTRTYGAKLVENVTQAVARDFLAEAMLRLEDAGYEIVATVHDEIIAEVPNGYGSLAEFERLMEKVPRWGLGCPIDVEGYEAERYRK